MPPATVSVPLRWRDLDVMGHVYQGVYHEFLEEARAAILQPLRGGVGYPLVLAHVGIDHVRELRHADGPVTVATAVAALGASSVVLRHEVSRADGVVSARARSVLVAFDVQTRRPRELAADERGALGALLDPADDGPRPARVEIASPGPVRTSEQLRWRDMNPMGHMDQGRFQELLDDARAAVFAPITGPLGFPLVLARAELDLRREVARADDRIEIASGVEALGTRKVVLGHRLTLRGGDVVAEVRSTMVAFDRETRGSRDLTDAERAMLEALRPGSARP